MVYTESIRGYPYMRKEQLTKEFQISAGTVRTRLFEIEDEIKTGRYNVTVKIYCQGGVLAWAVGEYTVDVSVQQKTS